MNTVAEAIALSQLLQWVMLDASPSGLPIPTSLEARDAAALLAEKARKTGACLYSSEQVKQRWPFKHRVLRPDECHCVICKKTERDADALICTLAEPNVCICSQCIGDCSTTLRMMVVTKQQRKARAAAKPKE